MDDQPKRYRSVKPRAELIAELRVAAGMSVEDLAAKSKLSERTIRSIEAGKRVHIRTLSAVAGALKVWYSKIVVPPRDSLWGWDRARENLTDVAEMARDVADYHGDALQDLITKYNRAANHTIAYCAQVKSGMARNRETELQLSDLWLLVAEPLRAAIGSDQYSRKVVLKARYWACIDCWSDEDIRAAGIELLPLIKSTDALIDQLQENDPDRES